ncbi:Uncharacterised protein [Mycobacteroides abscessus subsp. abscessus]|nr:Uncharacterised protein [Mycobacteroides abscessus subsp. abscessus]
MLPFFYRGRCGWIIAINAGATVGLPDTTLPSIGQGCTPMASTA